MAKERRTVDSSRWGSASDLAALHQELTFRWPLADIAESAGHLTWTYQEGDEWLDGSARESRRSVHLSGSPRLVDDFLAWLRQTFPGYDF